jgi:hypothetical protein
MVPAGAAACPGRAGRRQRRGRRRGVRLRDSLMTMPSCSTAHPERSPPDRNGRNSAPCLETRDCCELNIGPKRPHSDSPAFSSDDRVYEGENDFRVRRLNRYKRQTRWVKRTSMGAIRPGRPGCRTAVGRHTARPSWLRTHWSLAARSSPSRPHRNRTPRW